MAERVNISPTERFEILKRDKFTCQYCGRKAADGYELHVDHIHPVILGGTNVPENLRAACIDCNMGKGRRPLGVALDMPADDAPHDEQVAFLLTELKRRYRDHEVIPDWIVRDALRDSWLEDVGEFPLSQLMKWLDRCVEKKNTIAQVSTNLSHLAGRKVEAAIRIQKTAEDHHWEWVWSKALFDVSQDEFETRGPRAFIDSLSDDEKYEGHCDDRFHSFVIELFALSQAVEATWMLLPLIGKAREAGASLEEVLYEAMLARVGGAQVGELTNNLVGLTSSKFASSPRLTVVQGGAS